MKLLLLMLQLVLPAADQIMGGLTSAAGDLRDLCQGEILLIAGGKSLTLALGQEHAVNIKQFVNGFDAFQPFHNTQIPRLISLVFMIIAAGSHDVKVFFFTAFLFRGRKLLKKHFEKRLLLKEKRKIFLRYDFCG